MIGEQLQIVYSDVHSDIVGGQFVQGTNSQYREVVGVLNRMYNRLSNSLNTFVEKLGDCEVKIKEIYSTLEDFKALDWVIVMKAMRENSFRGVGGSPNSTYAYIAVANSNCKCPAQVGLSNLTSLGQIIAMDDDQINEYLEFYSIYPKESARLNKMALMRYIGVAEELCSI